MSSHPEDVLGRLRELEEALWRPETRQSPEWMGEILADEFVEIGASGDCYSRDDVLAPTSGSLDVVLPLPEFSVREIAPGRGPGHLRERPAPSRTDLAVPPDALRCGYGGATRWLLAFHQGTPTKGD